MHIIRAVSVSVFLSFIFVGMAAAQTLASANGKVSVGTFAFTDWEGPEIDIAYAEPDNAAPDTPIIIVMHGATRNAKSYRNHWIDIAQQFGFVVYVPEFKKKDFPTSSYYQLGGLTKDEPGDRVGAFKAIEPLFKEIKKRRGSKNKHYYLFGHSAGGQFVHRYAFFVDKTNYKIAFAANAGWYTMPSMGHEWPYGLDNLKTSRYNMKRVLKKPLYILLGDQDTLIDEHLRTTAQANAQGKNRFQRGLYFLKTAKAVAKTNRWKLNWKFAVVPGVGHSQKGMAQAAAQIIAAEEQSGSK